MCLARKTLLDPANRNANKNCGQGKEFTTALSAMVSKAKSSATEFHICLVCDARVGDKDWQVLTRYGGQHLETWYKICDGVAFRLEHNTKAITFDNSMPTFEPFGGESFYWASQSENDGHVGYKLRCSDELADATQVDGIIGNYLAIIFV